jgi:hypothetical protein
MTLRVTRVASALLVGIVLAGSPAVIVGKDPLGPVGLPADNSDLEALDPAEVAAKAADFEAFLLAHGATSGTVSLEAPCPLGADTVCEPGQSKTLAMNKYHQMTNAYCLPASFQTILNTKFGGYVTGGVKAGQTAIMSGINATAGANSLLYLNNELKKHPRTPSNWVYAVASVSKWEDLWGYIIYDVGQYNWPTWVKVDWNDPLWPDHSSSSTVVGHASLAIGYVPAPTYNVVVYDPWSYIKSSGGCYFGPGYSSSPTAACSFSIKVWDYYTTTVDVHKTWY